MSDPQLDEVGYWTEVKLDIIREYAQAYSRIMAAQTAPRFEHVYIEGFAGAGLHTQKATGKYVLGSPTNALLIEPPFTAYHFVDLDGDKIRFLRELVPNRPNIHFHHEDANRALLEDVFPQVRREDYRRGLCILDPYGAHLDARVVEMAGQMGSLELFVNFPVMDINRNMLRRDTASVNEAQAQRMTTVWGDDTWRRDLYPTDGNLFEFEEKVSNDALASAYRLRLQRVFGFAHVAQPMPMRNSKGAVVYYLYFASQNRVGMHIVNDIFAKYAGRGVARHG